MKQSATLFLGVLLLAQGEATDARADQRILNPSIALREEYTDNLYFGDNSKEDDFITTISPGLAWANRTERLKTGLNVRWDANQYSRNDELNNVDQDYSANLRYELTPRASLFTSGGYLVDSRSDRDFTETGLVTGTEHRDKYTFSLGGDYALSEISQVQLRYAFDREDYQTERYTDHSSHDVTLSLSRDLSYWLANTVGRINFGLSEYESDTLKVKNYTATVGVERNLNEKFSYFIDIGGHYTDSTYDTYRLVTVYFFGFPVGYYFEPYTSTSTGSGLTGQMGLSYSGEVTSGSLNFSHDVRPASSDNGTVERSSLQCKVQRRLSEVSRVGFSAGYAMNKSSQEDLFSNPVDEKSLWLGPSFNYDITHDITFEASYKYQLIYDNNTESEYDRNLFLVKLGFKYPLLD